MTKFAYNNVKNASIGYTIFEFNYGYHFCIFFQKKRQSLFSIKNSLQVISQTTKAHNHLQGKFLLYSKVFEASLQ